MAKALRFEVTDRDGAIFVHSKGLSPTLLDKKLNELAEPQRVTQVMVDGIELASLEGFARFARLESLWLTGCKLQSLNGADALVALDVLYVKGSAVTTLEPLARCAKLTRLELHACKIRSFETIPVLPALRDVSIESSSLRSLAGIERLGGLERLDIPGTKVRDLTPLRALSKLKYLDITGLADIESVAPLLALTHLTELDASDCGISAEALAPLAAHALRSVRGVRAWPPASTMARAPRDRWAYKTRAAMRGVDFSDDGTRIAVATTVSEQAGCAIAVVDANTSAVVGEWYESGRFEGGASGVVFASADEHGIWASVNGTGIHFISLDGSKNELVDPAVGTLLRNADSSRLVLCNPEEVIGYRAVGRRVERAWSFKHPSCTYYSVVGFGPDGDVYAHSEDDRGQRVTCYAFASGQELGAVPLPQSARWVALSHDGMKIAAHQLCGPVVVMDLTTGRIVECPQGFGQVYAGIFSRDGACLFLISDDVHRLDLATGDFTSLGSTGVPRGSYYAAGTARARSTDAFVVGLVSSHHPESWASIVRT